MSHNCPECGELCYCDGEDHLNTAASDNCIHFASGDCEAFNEEYGPIDPNGGCGRPKNIKKIKEWPG